MRLIPFPSLVTQQAARVVGRPRFATITGSYEGKEFSMRLSRTIWMLTGSRDSDVIGVKIDHDGKSMLGDIGSRRVELAFHWTPVRSLVQGTYNGAPIRYNVDFRDVGVVGAYAGKPFRLAFDRQSRKVTGSIDGVKVLLDYNPMSGRLNGNLAGRSLDVTLVNQDLGEFFQYFFVLFP